MTSHYFTTPQGPDQRSELEVDLRGHRVTVTTTPGVFSPKGLDKGTAVLLADAPDPQGHELLDLGCGWGPLALAMALDGPPSARITAVDVNERSVALTRDNAAAVGVGERVEACVPDQVPAERRFDTIWSNPPIRIGKEALHQMLLHWLPRLTPTGTAWLVVQKNLGADSLHTWLARELPEHTVQNWAVERASSSKGFRVLSISRRSL